MKKLIALCLFLIFLTTGTLVAQEKNTEHTLSVYGWFPTLDGELRYRLPGDTREDITQGDTIDTLESDFMGSYELRINGFLLYADLMYLKVSGDKNLDFLNSTLDEELAWKLYNIYGGYNLVDNKSYRLDAIAGLKYLELSLGLDMHTPIGTASSNISSERYNYVVGIMGEYKIDENWYMPYFFDIGTGDSDLTWQASLSLGYKFGWGDVVATYRYLHNEQDDALLVQEFNLYGPKLGVALHF